MCPSHIGTRRFKNSWGVDVGFCTGRRNDGVIMAKFTVTVDVIYRKEIKVFADDESEAEEKATDVCKKWNGVHDAEAVETKEGWND